MSYNGSGTFLINTAGQPVVSGTVISSTAFNALTADLATGLSTAITKDGQTTVTANIPMSTYKFTGLGAGSAATDSANLSQVQSTVSKLLNTITGTNTITATASPTLSAYATGQMFYFVAAGDNTTAVTLNIDGLGAKAVTRDGSTALISGDIKSGEVVVVVYDGTRFQVVSQVNSAGDATFANVSITSALNVGGVSTFVGNAGFSANVSIASALSVGGVAAITGATTIGGNLTLSGGNLAFTSTAQRVTADMSNGTVSNRFAFQTSTTNGNTQVNSIPNGTSTTAQFIAYNNSDPNNASSAQLAATSTTMRLLAGQTGTGTYLPITFFTSGAEQARLDTSGNLLVGITSASASSRLRLRSSGSTSSTVCAILENSVGTQLLYARDDGFFAIPSSYNNTSGSAANVVIDANGFLYRSTSSLKYKKDIQDATHGLAEVMALRPVTYKGNAETDADKVFGGLIAEEVDAAGLSEFVVYDADGKPDALHYGNMVSLLVKAIQELKAELDALKGAK